MWLKWWFRQSHAITKDDIDAAYHFLAKIKVSYFLQAVFVDKVLETFFRPETAKKWR